MTLREMLERRAAIGAEMRTLNEKPSGENGDLAPEQRTRWDALKAELTGLDEKISRQSTIDDLDRRASGESLTGDRHLDREMQGVGLLDVIRAGCGGTDEAAGRAREMSQEMERRSGRKAQGIYWDMRTPMERRVVTTALPVAGPGGALIPTDYRPDLFIDRLRNATKVRALGATVLSGLTGNVQIPRLKASVAAGWVAENSPLPVSDPQFDGVTLSPKHAGVITEWSRNMLQQASPDVETLARNDMAQVLSELLDSAAIAGTGTNNQPRGILNTSGIGTVSSGANGGPTTYENIAALVAAVDTSNAAGSTLGFLSNSKVKLQVSLLRDGMGNPFTPAVIYQNSRVEYSNLVPNNLTKGTGTNLSAVLYGNWADLLIGVWSELDILVNPYESTAYSKGNVSIRAMMTVDIAVRHPESFAAITDVATP